MKNALKYTKAIAALVGSVVTAVVGVVGADSQYGPTLAIILAVATAVATFQLPNAE